MKVHAFESLASTQTYCLEKHPELEDFCVVVCERQTGGIGRSGRSWVSVGESLTFSICLKLKSPPLKNLSVRVSWTVKRVLEAHGVGSLRVKWPNDVCIQKTPTKTEKVSGILINTVENETGTVHIIGIGINLGGVLPYATIDTLAAQPINKHQLMTDIAEEVAKEAKNGPDTPFSETQVFPHNHLYLNKEIYKILTVGDTLVLEGKGGRQTVSLSEYSYDLDRNTLTWTGCI
ncbi:BirA family transcriptional regulator [Nematocida displodere]|uniref:BirA family transcriptional regulator n=1 Tax=Nematocida displodere TaxID=1805483 RepID=A0A177EC62_9MICR|nr:BirA family transcriptional regulator [Nematocida displodere]